MVDGLPRMMPMPRPRTAARQRVELASSIEPAQDCRIVARFVRRIEWPGPVGEGGAQLADLMAIAAASEDGFMVNRAPSAGARDIISRAFFHELKESIARYDLAGVAVKPLADFEVIMACTAVGLIC